MGSEQEQGVEAENGAVRHGPVDGRVVEVVGPQGEQQERHAHNAGPEIFTQNAVQPVQTEKGDDEAAQRHHELVGAAETVGWIGLANRGEGVGDQEKRRVDHRLPRAVLHHAVA